MTRDGQRRINRDEKSPTLGEAAAVMAAVVAYRKKLHPGSARTVGDLPEELRELRESIERLESVTQCLNSGAVKDTMPRLRPHRLLRRRGS